MLPIPGTASVKHLEEDVMGAMIKLTQEEFDVLDRETTSQRTLRRWEVQTVNPKIQ
jgi:aryl-alcohol dehydrogenase-like predicted oxidoreductase